MRECVDALLHQSSRNGWSAPAEKSFEDRLADKSVRPASFITKKQADPLSRVTGPRMNPSVDVGRPPRPFRHLRMAERCSPDPSSSRAPVHSALVQISVTRHHQRGRPAFNLDAREIRCSWQVEERKKLAGRLQSGMSGHATCQSGVHSPIDDCKICVNRDLGPQKYLILLRRCAFILKNQKIGSRACFAGA